MTEMLYLQDAYLKTCQTRVERVSDLGIVLEQTVFYPRGGGQPGDTGNFKLASGRVLPIIDTIYGPTREVLHVPEAGHELPAKEDAVEIVIDWERRYRLMRMHTSLHFLGVALPYGVTGGSIGERRSRLDFDMQDPIDKEVVNEKINQLIAGKHTAETIWTDWEELDKRPDLIRTMSVKPPRVSEKIRLLKIGDLDLQPCGGTHVKNSSEIGRVIVSKIEKKGKHNRRVYLELADQ
jgi:misacylated tRNA(Ala) deacylase